MLQRRNELLAGTVTAHEGAAHCRHMLGFQPVVIVDYKARTHPTKLVGGQAGRCGVQEVDRCLHRRLMLPSNVGVCSAQESAVGMRRSTHVVETLSVCARAEERVAHRDLSKRRGGLVASALFCSALTPPAAFEPGAPPGRAIRGCRHPGGRAPMYPVVHPLCRHDVGEWGERL